MRITRRHLLLASASAAGASAVAAAGFFASGSQAATKPARKLVLIELQGGNDGINTVIPSGDALYRKLYRTLRPSLAIDDALEVDRSAGRGLALHPALQGLAAIFERGELAIVQGVGYANPVRSHFRSADIWHTGSAANEARTDGWIARVLDGRNARGLVVGGDAGPLDGPGFAALAADGDKTARRTERAISNDALAHLARIHDEVKAGRKDIDAALGRGDGDDDGDGGGVSPRAVQGKAFLEQARLAARALASLDVAVIKLTLRGFDTHAGQLAAHARLLQELSEGLVELRRRAISDGTWATTIVATTSEFGRRARENGSGGTDHGTAGPMFVLGGGVRGGVRGAAPRLDDLDEEGDIKMTTDHRAVLGGLAVGAWNLPASDVKHALGGVAPLSFV